MTKAIIPDKDPRFLSRLEQGIRKEAVKFGARVLRKGTKYPPQVSAASPVFKKRKRATNRGRKGSRYASKGYRRTGTLRRSWFQTLSRRGSSFVVVVASSGNVAPYNIYVQGEKETQSKLMRSRGWISVPESAEEELKKTEVALQKLFDRLTR